MALPTVLVNATGGETAPGEHDVGAAGSDAGRGREFDVTLEFDAVKSEIEGQRGLRENTLENLRGGGGCERGGGRQCERRGSGGGGCGRESVAGEVEGPTFGHQAAQGNSLI